jgi:hypothetical protein
MRAVVLLPTATLPAIPITYGTFAAGEPRNVAVAWWRRWIAPT